MPAKSKKPLTPVTLRLYDGDRETLLDYYPEVGYNVVVREIVHRHCSALKEQAARQGVTDHAKLAQLADANPIPDELLSDD